MGDFGGNLAAEPARRIGQGQVCRQNFSTKSPTSEVSLLEGYLNVRSLNNSCSKDVCIKTFEGAQTMEKANINTYLFPNITVVIFSLVNAIYLVGVHPCH